MGRIKQSRHSGNNYWTDLIYHNRHIPVVTTDDLSMGFAANATAEGTLVSGSNITSYGFVWAEHDNPTIDDEVVEVGTTTELGAFSDTFGGLPFSGTVYVAAYATNNVGTGYGTVLSGEPQICLAAGTKISTLYGLKNIEEIDYSDELIVWNFDNGVYDQAKPIWMVKPFVSKSCAMVTFSDGSSLTTVNDGNGHSIFNVEQGRFTHMMSDDTPVGTATFAEDGSIVKVIHKEIINQRTTFYNVITHTHMNVFANGLLTSTGMNNLYPIVDMQFVKEHRTLRMREEFDCSLELFDGFRLAEQPLDYPNLKQKISRLTRRQFNAQVVS